jgi:methylmalonyl-CoA mutase C-terminal domain/subunit
MSKRHRILLAKTGLDGHWRGLTVVATALRDAGFEIIMIGMSTVDEIVQAAVDEDVDLVGLSIGGHVEVAERIIKSLRKEGIDKPIFAGGVVPPWAIRRLHALDVVVHPPGSQLPDIVASAEHLTGRGSAPSS